ncbi:MAG: undecaprenyldiphospho-muramoylpentapeptide beta-N-acetylglucosaminyltransferase [Gammaproteobacteria bacterium RIFCSPHIGHO2_12_FULL_43_28]|nr:MAG: undecaprenyldiphospho-muramoylpentapeptide beta-N-acetylglucosaminyltransferase [Gammaproteobacteria bacterium RIFCSPHIGHO2_12_FULL_43_28]
MAETKLKRVLIMAGGTGGHIFPGLAVANRLQADGVEVVWLGTENGLESRLVPSAGFPLYTIKINGLRGKGIKTFLIAPFKIVAAIIDARAIIRVLNPDVVIGMGGFASGPGGIASWLSRRPLIIHEQNATAGLTNKMLARIAKRVLEGFPGAFKSRKKVVTVGNPVRTEIINLPKPKKRLTPLHSPLRLLVLGGSLGARALNEIVPQALMLLAPEERPVVLHQTGNKLMAIAKKAYESADIDVTLQPFIEDMAAAYGWADIVICRAGALTVAELCTVGLGAILIPFPHAVDDHQTANAEYMVRGGAAYCIQQPQLSKERLADELKQFIDQHEKCLTMAEAAYRLRYNDVTEKIVGICEEVSS